MRKCGWKGEREENNWKTIREGLASGREEEEEVVNEIKGMKVE